MPQTNENIKIAGEWTGYSFSKDIKESDPIVSRLRAITRKQIPEHEGQKFIRNLKEKNILIKVVKQTNLVPTVGRNAIARLLTGDTNPGGEINYIGFGTGTTAFTNASTILNTETYRKLVSDAAHDDNIAYIDVFIASGDVADQTFTEAGAFINGGAGTATGTAFSLVVQNFAKSGSMYVSLQVTLT